MLTRKLDQAYKETDNLVNFLKKRDWNNSDELLAILERADREIEEIANKAVSDILDKLENRYSREAGFWAENKMTNANGKQIKISQTEQKKARTELNKINRVMSKLREIL